ncbi:MAG TPA: hypothetical protein VHP56_08615 [Solirubrobacterales bacterium]|nr:hypothetical protein [Solirubrobacterales bacterium]
MREQPDSVGALAACALAGWVLAAALFMYAVAAPYESPERRSEVYGSKAFIQKAIDSAEEERDTIDRRRLRAQWAALLASVLTVAAIVLATFLPHPSEFEKANVTLGRAERTRLSRLCGHRLTPVISGEIDIGSLDDGTIRFEPSNRQCIRDGATSLKEAETSYLLEG